MICKAPFLLKVLWLFDPNRSNNSYFLCSFPVQVTGGGEPKDSPINCVFLRKWSCDDKSYTCRKIALWGTVEWVPSMWSSLSMQKSPEEGLRPIDLHFLIWTWGKDAHILSQKAVIKLSEIKYAHLQTSSSIVRGSGHLSYMVEPGNMGSKQVDRLAWGMAFMRSWKEKYTTRTQENKNNIIKWSWES